MTRGYVVVTNGKREIVNAVYSPGSSYMSYLGTQLIERLKTGTIEDYVDKERRQYRNQAEMAEGIIPEWYRKTKNRRSAEYDDKYGCISEYGYEYDRDRKILRVFHYGNLLCTITAETADYWMYVASHESDLFDALQYDKEKLRVENNMEKLYRMLRDKTVEDLENMLPDIDYPILEMDDFLCDDVWQRDGCKSYLKKFQFRYQDESKETITCIVQTDLFSRDKKWNAQMQLPWFRIILSGEKLFPSLKSAVNFLRRFVQQNRDELFGFAQACSIFQDYCEAADYEYSIAKEDTMPEYMAKKCKDLGMELKELWERNPWGITELKGCQPETFVCYFSKRFHVID